MESSPDQYTLAAIFANWNGEAFIERALASLLASIRRTGRTIETVVYDDASEDRSPELIAASFPGVRLIRGETNAGYGAAVNRAMAATAADWVFLLNNDLALPADFCERLLATLDEHRSAPLFAIGARTRDWESGADNHGGQRAAWREGMIAQVPFESEGAARADFFQAGACLIDRRKFLRLGGFSPIFHPGYWEDYDLAWQAKGLGWEILYESRAVAMHLGKGSMRRRLGARGVSLALRRNHLLFNWMNIREPGKLARHLAGLPGLALEPVSDEDQAGWGTAFLAALGRLPLALKERRKRRNRLPPSPPG